MGHGRRQLLWFAVTRYPTAEWLAQQIVEAFPWHTAPTYLVRDNDGAYGQAFTRRVRAMGIRDRPISPRSPWQNRYAGSAQQTDPLEPAGRRFANFFFEQFFFEIFRFWGERWSSGVRGPQSDRTRWRRLLAAVASS